MLDAIHTTRAQRYLKPDPIPGRLWQILDAAIRGPTGGNQQGWVGVIRDRPRRNREDLETPAGAYGSSA